MYHLSIYLTLEGSHPLPQSWNANPNAKLLCGFGSAHYKIKYLSYKLVWTIEKNNFNKEAPLRASSKLGVELCEGFGIKERGIIR